MMYPQQRFSTNAKALSQADGCFWTRLDGCVGDLKKLSLQCFQRHPHQSHRDFEMQLQHLSIVSHLTQVRSFELGKDQISSQSPDCHKMSGYPSLTGFTWRTSGCDLTSLHSSIFLAWLRSILIDFVACGI